MKKLLMFVVLIALCIVCQNVFARTRLVDLKEYKNDIAKYKLSNEKVIEAVKLACKERGWKIEDTKVKDGTTIISAKLVQKSKYLVFIDIYCSNKMYKIVYTNSINMDANNGKINQAYERWINNLIKSTENNLLSSVQLK